MSSDLHTECNFDYRYPIFLANNAKYIGGHRVDAAAGTFDIFDATSRDCSKTEPLFKLNLQNAKAPSSSTPTIGINSYNEYTFVAYIDRSDASKLQLSVWNFKDDKIPEQHKQINIKDILHADITEIRNLKVRRDNGSDSYLVTMCVGDSETKYHLLMVTVKPSSPSVSVSPKDPIQVSSYHYGVSAKYVMYNDIHKKWWVSTLGSTTSTLMELKFDDPLTVNITVEDVCFVENSDVNTNSTSTMFACTRHWVENNVDKWCMNVIYCTSSTVVVSPPYPTGYRLNNETKWTSDPYLAHDMCARFINGSPKSTVEIYLDVEIQVQASSPCKTNAIMKYIIGFNETKRTFSQSMVDPGSTYNVYCNGEKIKTGVCPCEGCAIDLKHNHTDSYDKSIYAMLLCSGAPKQPENGINASRVKVTTSDKKAPFIKKPSSWGFWKIAGGLLIVVGVMVYVGFMLWLWNKRSETKIKM